MPDVLIPCAWLAAGVSLLGVLLLVPVIRRGYSDTPPWGRFLLHALAQAAGAGLYIASGERTITADAATWLPVLYFLVAVFGLIVAIRVRRRDTTQDKP
ncbi:hypothetical protein [Streptomyces nanshensis]|uniref:Uncharacterized protein n=1 Tax=Streptomyces nanshensis TaxID=518642 RepID=A0A1E7L9T4_9ACTN|nr:hypothetical protein [Streptomyces nanshensis]OEV12995.1 hypothetical protein AN218_05660 [Streptomyces nanshensis]